MSSQILDWLECENTRHGFRERPDNPLATYTEFPEKYRPGADPYNLQLYRVPNNLCLKFQSSTPDSRIITNYFLDNVVLFPVHPVNLDNHKIPNIDDITKHPSHSIRVHPTSSTRTVFVLNRKLPIHCIKPHTDLQVTRWRRHMEARKVAHAVAVTRIFESSSVFKKSAKIGFFPESLGAVYGTTGSKKDWGFIVREMVSKPALDVPYTMIPLNALYIPSSTAPNTPPLLVEMINKSSLSPRQFISEQIIQPLVAGWFDIYLQTGVLLEPHGQNVIVEIDEKGGILRFSHRDFDCEVNKDILLKNGFTLKDLNSRDLFSTEGDSWAPQGSHLSIIYDNSMKVVLEALAELAERYFQVPSELIREDCRTFLNKHFSGFLKEHFPRNGKTYNFKKEEQGISIVEKPTPPTWRTTSESTKSTHGWSRAIFAGVTATAACIAAYLLFNQSYGNVKTSTT